MAANVVEKYLKDLGEIYRTGGGVEEESYYGALETLLNEVGKKLKPRVRCVSQLKNVGAGEPDFGLFTANQFQRAKDERPMGGQLPERGVIECKPWNDDSFARTKSAQVSKYWKRYGLVLVTNYRDFVLVAPGEDGKPIRLESYRMAETENSFGAMLAHPRKAAQQQGDRLVEFLRRAMLHAAALTEPEDLAWFLASYAREARARVEHTANLPALEGLKRALEEALGMKFEGEKGEHFFQATLVQTLFYGVFSSWVLWSRENWGHPEVKFNWHDAAWTLHVPMVASLFEQIATPNRLKPLGVDEVLDWAGMVLNRVDRPVFFAKFEEEHAVQYFYEPFLKAYDPDLRKELGVWYTPPEIVQYQVERVDRILREELKIADGLADEQVVILDPCCGTGAYLVETLKRIHKTLEEKGGSALTAQRLKKAAKERVFGFEILPAPFVVSHLQIGLMLRLLGAPLNAESNERAGVYLTNALTGWEPLEDPKTLLPFPELMEERDAANKVKCEAPILVILGNPPYNTYAGVSPAEEDGLVEPYKRGLRENWKLKKHHIDDFYVRFFRVAERRIVKSGKGVVSYISNFSYLGDPSFVVMRQHFLEAFDKMWIDCMNGDSRETGKLTPEGEPDPSVFSTEQSPVGIRVGTAICVLVRKQERANNAVVRFQHYWGITKRQDVLDSLQLKYPDRKYQIAKPTKANRYSFRAEVVFQDYRQWPLITEMASSAPLLGMNENRGGDLVEIERDVLERRMNTYYDKDLDWESYISLESCLATPRARFDPKITREKALRTERFCKDRVVRHTLRPFDVRWCYYTDVRPVWNEPRPALWEQVSTGGLLLLTRPYAPRTPEGPPLYPCHWTFDQNFFPPAYAFSIRLREEQKKAKFDPNQKELFEGEAPEPTMRANLSETARVYLRELGLDDPDKDVEPAAVIWMHALAIGYSPAYQEENADGIRQGWPRIPLPSTKKALVKSAELGLRIAALLDTERPVEGVTCGTLQAELRSIGVISKVGGGALDLTAGELDVTAGWGHAGKGGVCMPGRGKYEVRSQKEQKLRKAFGEETLDVYLNEIAYWANVPKCVWEYHIGGYQVIKKWLSYREKALLGRGLKVDEAEYVTEMARRLSALIILQGELDANYDTVRTDTWAWPREE